MKQLEIHDEIFVCIIYVIIKKARKPSRRKPFFRPVVFCAKHERIIILCEKKGVENH